VALGALFWTRGRPAAALDAFDRALAADPDDIAALLLGHDAAWIAGRTAEATARLDRAIAADPDSVPALLRLLERNVRKGEIDGRANEPLERLRRLAPELAEVHAARAAHLRAQGLESEARKVLLDFVEAHPDDAHGWLAFARSAFASGAVDEATSAIERATALDPHSAEIGGEALRIASHARSVDLSTLVDSMLARFPDHWPIAAGAALAIGVSGGATERALSISARALDLEPGLPLALLIHGEVLARVGRVSEAMAVLETGLLRLPPGDGHLQAAPALLRMAELCRGRGHLEAAASFFARAASAACIVRGQDLARARVWEEAALVGLEKRVDAPSPAPSVEARGFCAGAAA
jgi:tetratricopeptide (TPR) repeat protein